jgi:zinc protease
MTVEVARGLSPVRTVLENRAVVLVQETSTTPAVTINATFSSGNVYEPAELPGLASLTGRVLDRGTERRSAEVIAEELDDRGVALKVSTSRHTLTLSCTCLAEDFNDLLDVVLDVARCPVFPEDEIDKRRAEIITAVQQDHDNPGARATEALFELLYGVFHPYGRSAKGTVESLERIRRHDIVAFHNSRLRPGSLTLAIVGDVRSTHAVERAAAGLEGWEGAVPEDLPVAPPAGGRGRRHREIDMAGKSQADIAYGFAAIRRLDPRYNAYWVMNNILGQFGLGGRLAENIRERQGMAYYAFSAFDPSFGEGPLFIRAGVDPRNVDRALAAIDFEVSRLAAEGPTKAEVEETRDYLIGSIPRMLETNQSIAIFLQTAEQFGLGLDYDQQLSRHLREVTLEQVHVAAAELLHPEEACVVVAGPNVRI